MKTFDKVKILKDLIDSDFLIVNSQNQKNRNQLNSGLKISHKENFDVLNGLETNKNLKQFIRLVQSLKKEEIFSLYVWVESKYFSSLFSSLIKECHKNVRVGTTMPSFQSASLNNLLFVLDQPISNFSDNFSRKFVNNNIFLISKINLKIEKNFFGNYKIYNTLKDLKKIIFISIILRLVISSK